MFVQFYRDGYITSCPARLFHGDDMVAALPGKSLDDVDKSIRLLGWRRSQRWQRASWGYEAKLRRAR
jgi:hypothetical protein